nr:MAG TPA: hypothetical protein [Caudoviricetes sp.]
MYFFAGLFMSFSFVFQAITIICHYLFVFFFKLKKLPFLELKYTISLYEQ